MPLLSIIFVYSPEGRGPISLAQIRAHSIAVVQERIGSGTPPTFAFISGDK